MRHRCRPNQLSHWNITRQKALDEIEASPILPLEDPPLDDDTRPLQLNHAYTLLLAGQFQAFCRDPPLRSGRPPCERP